MGSISHFPQKPKIYLQTSDVLTWNVFCISKLYLFICVCVYVCVLDQGSAKYGLEDICGLLSYLIWPTKL